jgi:predicted transcriptional regulator
MIPTHEPADNPHHTIDWSKYDKMRAEGRSQREIAPQLGISQPTLSRRLAARHKAETSAADTIPDIAPTATNHGSVMVQNGAEFSADLYARVKALEAHRLVVDSFLATLQRQVVQTTVQSQCRAGKIPPTPSPSAGISGYIEASNAVWRHGRRPPGSPLVNSSSVSCWLR